MRKVPVLIDFIPATKTVLIKIPYHPLLIRAIKASFLARWDPTSSVWRLSSPDPTTLATFAEEQHAVMTERAAEYVASASQEPAETVLIPKTRHTPWEHQRQAYAYLERADAALLDMGMGTGKTKVIIDYLQNHDDWERVLILCPKSVIDVWPYQAIHHAIEPLPIVPLGAGSVAQRTTTLRQHTYTTERGIYVLNYESAWREPMATALAWVAWDIILLDESHRIKAPAGKASRLCQRLGRTARKRICLTGTPLPHSPMDIYAQYRFLAPEIFGTSAQRFRAQYAIMGGFKGHEIVGWQNTEEMQHRINRIRFFVSRNALDLPEVVATTLPAQLPASIMRLYARLERDFYLEVDAGTVTASNALVKILRLQQLTSGYLRSDEGIDQQLHRAKEEVLTDYLLDLPRDEPVVVFGRFHWDLNTAHNAATAAKCSILEHSGRRKDLLRWQQGQAQVLAVQIGAGAEGIDLTRAAYAIYLAPTHSLGQWEQAHARVHRPGQQKTVHNVYIQGKGTIDEQIYKALQAKRDVIHTILSHAANGDSPRRENSGSAQ